MKIIMKLVKKIFTKKKDEAKKKDNYKYFDEEEWREARAFDMFGEAHYSCGDKD